jgi:tetratricopeptide (TPR) repeat protein
MTRAPWLAATAIATAACGGAKPVPAPTTIDGLDAVGLVDRARHEVATQDFDAADRDYASAYRLAADVAVVDERLGVLARTGRADAAVAVAADYRAAHPGGHADALAADALLAAGRGSDAAPIADAMVARDGKAPDGHAARGRALLLQGKPDDGVAELRAARDLAPAAAAYHAALGRALDKLGKVDEAQLELRAAVKLAPDDADINVDLATTLREQQIYAEAKAYLDHAIAVAPTSGHAYFELGRLDNAQNQDAAAEAALAKAVQYAPYDSLYWYAYGEVFRLHDRDDEAIKAYTAALALPHPAPKARGKLGAVLARAQRYPEAEQALAIAAQDQANDPVVQAGLGDLYAGTNRAKQAAEAYRKYLELADPGDRDRARVQQALARLRR